MLVAALTDARSDSDVIAAGSAMEGGRFPTLGTDPKASCSTGRTRSALRGILAISVASWQMEWVPGQHRPAVVDPAARLYLIAHQG